jgi:hypothetical protein
MRWNLSVPASTSTGTTSWDPTRNGHANAMTGTITPAQHAAPTLLVSSAGCESIAGGADAAWPHGQGSSGWSGRYSKCFEVLSPAPTDQR